MFSKFTWKLETEELLTAFEGGILRSKFKVLQQGSNVTE